MEKRPRHRPHRVYPEARRVLIDCELENCPSCGKRLKRRRPWHASKTIQTLQGPVFLAGKSKECVTPECANYGKHYYASGLSMWSLPNCTYGLDVLAYIGWQHEHEHRQLVEIQQSLNQRGIEINERHTGRLYRQFLALLSASREQEVQVELGGIVQEYGGPIWAMDGLEPEGSSQILYVLYEVQSGKAMAAWQSPPVSEAELVAWLQPFQAMGFPVLATLSDGERALASAFKTCWPSAPHQRCQAHFLNNLAQAVLPEDDQLRQAMRQDLGGLPPVAEWQEAPADASAPLL
jgi:hypothetical protein